LNSLAVRVQVLATNQHTYAVASGGSSFSDEVAASVNSNCIAVENSGGIAGRYWDLTDRSGVWKSIQSVDWFEPVRLADGRISHLKAPKKD
jgi:hypothetical protein